MENALFERALWAFVGAMAALLVREILYARRKKINARKRRNNLVRSLYAEIDFNSRDLEIFLEKSPDEEALKEKMAANPALVPHITDARHTHIYTTRMNELHDVKDPTLSKMVHFYGMLEKIKVQIDGVNYPSYLTLSVEGRMNGVMVIVRTSTTAHQYGLELLKQLEDDFPQLELKRFKR